jgi:hypothetical protein
MTAEKAGLFSVFVGIKFSHICHSPNQALHLPTGFTMSSFFLIFTLLRYGIITQSLPCRHIG